jgi:UTP--glucose-1-phosphate uridylyltransferase
MFKRVRKAVFPVAGMGTRALPATKSVPKEMLPVFDKPLIQHVFEEARNAGIEHFVLVTGRNKTAIEDHFDHAYELEDKLRNSNKLELLHETSGWLPPVGAISYVRQREPLGLGHAVWAAREIIGDEPFLVLLPDELFISETPFVKSLLDVYNEKGGNVIGVAEVPWEETNKYGIIATNSLEGDVVNVTGMVEKPSPDLAPSNLSITGQYILQPEVFAQIEEGKRGSLGEIQLTDAMAALIGKQPFHAVKFKGERLDCGNNLGWLQANLTMALRHTDRRVKTLDMMKKLLRNYI